MYVKCKVQACSWNHCCSGKAVCVCSLSYPVCNAHALYCHLWPVHLCNIFPHYLTNGTNFEEKKVI